MVRRERETAHLRLPFQADDGGFTQIGVMLATLLTVCLLMGATQAYWVRSNAADIQQAADAGVLAAGNVVDGYLVVARVADAVTLSLSLLGLTLYAAGAVAACIPFAEEVSAPLIRAADQVMDDRDRFCDQAVPALEHLQSTLPFLCAVDAASVIAANAAESPLGPGYVGIALPVPLDGGKVEEPDDGTDTAVSTMAENDPEVQKLSDAAADDEERMETAKEAGFRADCDPSGSQWERAGSLAGLGGGSNPRYSSVELWDFQVAIDRANAYYRARLEQEVPKGSGVEELGDSVARERFYRYALQTVARGRVDTAPDGSVSVSMPLLPANTADVRGTTLYTERVYPVSTDGEVRTLHASTGCPGFGTPDGTGSLAEIDDGSLVECPVCRYSVGDLGKTPAASTSIDNGFEYYYRAVALAAREYSEASRDHARDTAQAEEKTRASLDSYRDALAHIAGRRIDLEPPGRFGCIALVFDAGTHAAPFSSGELGGRASIGPRTAVAGCMLAPESPEDGANVVSSLLDGLRGCIGTSSEGAAVGGFAGVLLERTVVVWGDMLLAYTQGEEAFEEGVEKIAGKIPGVKESGLSGWARDTLHDIVELAGLQPVEMRSYRPVLVNTSQVLEHCDGISDVLEGARTVYSAVSSDYVLATVTLVDGLQPLELKVALPAAVEGDSGVLERFMDGWGTSSGIRRGGHRWG